MPKNTLHPRPTKPAAPRHACRFAPVAAAACIVLAFSGCAGYQVGNQALYPPGIETVYVPMFESVSFRENLGEQLTEAVMKEIEARTPYKVVSTPMADSVLSGRIVGETQRVIVEDWYDDPRDVEVNIRVQVRWVDRRGNILRNSTDIVLPEEFTEISASTDIIAEAGQSRATAQQQALERIARQIVDLMEAPW